MIKDILKIAKQIHKERKMNKKYAPSVTTTKEVSMKISDVIIQVKSLDDKSVKEACFDVLLLGPESIVIFEVSVPGLGKRIFLYNDRFVRITEKRFLKANLRAMMIIMTSLHEAKLKEIEIPVEKKDTRNR
jgi:hypothetical protein